MNLPNPISEPRPRRRRLVAGFTLIELLVVVAIIGILSSLLLTSLGRAKSHAQGIFCQNNSRQLILACLMYCDDNAGFFPYNLAQAAVHTNINWASDVLDWDKTSDNTNLAQLTGAALGHYMARSATSYR